VDSIRTPTLILHGELDDRVSAAQARELYRALRTIGTETQLVTYPREKHSIAERQHQLDLMTRVLGWYDRHLRDTEAYRSGTRCCRLRIVAPGDVWYRLVSG
jgi:dipeptidyl aminopeptidase/acylaminoacyl peptidase